MPQQQQAIEQRCGGARYQCWHIHAHRGDHVRHTWPIVSATNAQTCAAAATSAEFANLALAVFVTSSVRPLQTATHCTRPPPPQP